MHPSPLYSQASFRNNPSFMDCRPARLLCPGNYPGKNTGVGCHFLLQGIFPTQGSNPCLPHCKQTLYCLSHQVLDYCFKHAFSAVSDSCDLAPLFMGIPRQESWSGLPFPSPGDLPNSGIKPGSSALYVDSLLSKPSGKPKH